MLARHQFLPLLCIDYFDKNVSQNLRNYNMIIL